MEKKQLDKKWLMIIGAFLFFLFSFFFIFRPQMGKAGEMKVENESLKQKLHQLRQIEKEQSYYVTETEKMEKEVDHYLDSFPSDVKEEDTIALALDFEKLTAMDISNISISEKTEVGSFSPDSQQQTADGQQAATSTEQPAAAQADAAIDGTTQAQQPGTVQESTDSQKMILYNTMTAYDYRTDYRGLKKVMQSLFEDKKRRTIDSLSVTFDGGSGYISGTMNINAFSMSGTGQEYEEPNVPEVGIGVANPFKSLGKD